MDNVQWIMNKVKRIINGNFTRLRVFFTLCIIHFTLFNIEAQIGPKDDYFAVKDLRNNWLIYDQNLKDYVPFVAEQHLNEAAVSMLIDLESNRKYSLLIKVEKESHLFLNASLKEKLSKNQWRIFKIDSLYKIYRKPYLLLTIYGDNGIDNKKIFIGHRKNSTDKLIEVEDESFLNLRPRLYDDFKDFFTLCFVFIFGFTALLFNGFERAFARIFDLVDLITLEVSDETFLVNKPFSPINLMFLALLSLLIAFIYFFVTHQNFDLFNSTQLLRQGQTLGQNILTFILVSLAVFVIFYLKYILIFVLGQLYNITDVTNKHFFKITQSSIVFYTLLSILVIILSFYVQDWSKLISSLILIPTIAFYLLRMLLVYFSISVSSNIKNLYLISYLCIAEFIPIIICVRYVLM